MGQAWPCLWYIQETGWYCRQVPTGPGCPLRDKLLAGSKAESLVNPGVITSWEDGETGHLKGCRFGIVARAHWRKERHSQGQRWDQELEVELESRGNQEGPQR